jgi:hypothetical protein
MDTPGFSNESIKHLVDYFKAYSFQSFPIILIPLNEGGI